MRSEQHLAGAVDEAGHARAGQVATEGMVLTQTFRAHRLRQHRQLPFGHACGEELGLCRQQLCIGAGFDLLGRLRHQQPRRRQLGGCLGQAPSASPGDSARGLPKA